MDASPPPPPLPILAENRKPAESSGGQLLIGGRATASDWLWIGNSRSNPTQLWLPLDVLIGQIGFQRLPGIGGDKLAWFGVELPLNKLQQRSLGDEVALDVTPWFKPLGVEVDRTPNMLRIQLPQPQLQKIRQGRGSAAERLVLDLDGPALIQRNQDDLLLQLRTTDQQVSQLSKLGLQTTRDAGGLKLLNQSSNLSTMTLRKPWRVVLDGIRQQIPSSPNRQTDPLARVLLNPSIQKLLQKGLILDQRVVKVGVKPFRLNRAGIPRRTPSLLLRPLARREAQTGLRYLSQLAQPADALVAVNGGFFNRVRQLPLGAVRLDNQWLSGPILNRGAVGWTNSGPLVFGRLRLIQDLNVAGQRRWSLGMLNSGYVQRGLSRYTRAWGPTYRALSGEEQALTIRNGKVDAVFDQADLIRGVPLTEQGDLIVARAKTPLPANLGDSVTIQTRSSNPLGDLPQVMGGGPLLLHHDKVVLNGRQEGFSPGFLAVSAPRTVIAQDKERIWLLAIKGAAGGDPNLVETTLALQQLGLTDALNLDGGSSTTMLAANTTVMTGRGITPRIQNGLGFVNRESMKLAN